MVAPRRLSDRTRIGLRVAGVALLVAGLCLSVLAFVTMMSPSTAGMGEAGWFEERTSAMARSAMLFAGGGILLAVGFGLLMVSLQRALAEVAASESGAAVEHTAERVARGLRTGGMEGAPGRAAVRLKCRACGFLDSEDARFCSQCAAPM